MGVIDQPVVRGQIKLTRFRQGDTLTSVLISSRPLVQYVYPDGGVFPDWEIIDGGYPNSPVVTPSIASNISSLPLSGDEIKNPVWFYDGNKITSDDNRFQIITDHTDLKLPALRVVSNLMDGVTTNKTIRLECEAFTGGVSTPLFLTIDVQRQEINEATYSGEIAAKNGGMISETSPTEQLTARLMKGGRPVDKPDIDPSNETWEVEWWRVVSYDRGAEEEIGTIDPVTGDIIDGVDDGLRKINKEGRTITLTADDVHLSDTFMAKFILKENSTEVAYATRVVLDLTDSLMLKFTHDPATGVVEKTRIDIGTNDEVPGFVRSYPRVCKEHSDEEFKINGQVAFTKFSFSLRNAGYQVRTQDYDNTIGGSGIQYFDTLYSDFEKKTVYVEGTGDVELQETDEVILAVETQENWT